MNSEKLGISFRWRTCPASLRLITLLVFGCRSAYGALPVAVSQAALDQIGALLAEKASWTPVQNKMDSELVHAVKSFRGQSFASGATGLKPDVAVRPDGRVLVDITANVSSNLLALIKQGGGEVLNSSASFHAVRALVKLDQMETLAGLKEVMFIRRAVRALTNAGSVDSQGDVTHLAGAARTGFGVSGAGVKVGVLSDSVDYLASSQALGDLGTVTVLPGQSGVPGSGEGTAMLEIVHDLAPDAQLYFATAFSGEAGFAQNILDLYSNGCNIIIDDVGYFDESPFQDGIVAQAVNTVTAGGALYFSSAANSGNLDAGTSGTWEGDFVDGGAASSPIPEAGRLHSFGAFTYNTVTASGSAVDLFWSDPLGASTNDYDLFLLNSTGTTVVGSSMSRQNGTQDPYEYVGSPSTGQRIVIVKYSGDARFLHLDTQRGRLNIATSGATLGHSAATDAFSVAATPAPAAFPNPFTSANSVEPFSSDGPRHVFYQADGTPITPGNFLSTGGAVRQKPDITAADGVVTTLPSGSGLNPFYGTSAAAPHAGAIAALLWSYNPGLTPGQMRVLLANSAVDIGAAGVDRDSGCGIVMAYSALTNLAGTSPLGINLQPANQTVLAGGTATFSVTAVGTTPFSYFWQRNGTPIAGATNATCSTNNVQLADSGAQFSCLVSNVQGTLLSSNGTLTVIVPPANDQCGGAIAISSSSYTNSQSTTTASSTGDPTPDCFVGGFGNGVWYVFTAPTNGTLVVNTFGSSFDTGLAIYTGTCESLTQIACNDDTSGTVQSSITNSVTIGTTYYILAGGWAANTGNLVFHLAFISSAPTPPAILAQPANQLVTAGGTATFTLSAAGTAPLGYFWSRNGALIAGATNAAYSTNNVQLADSGSQFSCLVSNLLGSTNSQAATLTVASDWFSELFGAAITNLAFKSFTFTPDGSPNFYSVCGAQVATFPTDPIGGKLVSAGDDTYSQITLSGTNSVAIYNRRTNVLFIGSNGYLTMNAGDISYSPSYSGHFSYPRVSALYRDLNPGAGGTVSWKQLADRVAVTSQAVPIYGNSTQTNSFQVELFFNGTIRITYLNLNAPSGLVGVSAGSGQPANFIASDFATYGSCSPQFTLVRLLPGGSIQIGLTGFSGDVYRVLGSTNLVDWQTIASVTNVAGALQFTDPGATNFNHRFYRLVMP